MFNIILADDIGKLLLRLTLGALMLFHGVHKMLHPALLDSVGSRLTAFGIPMEFAFAVYLGEVLGPLLIIVGLFSRIGGLLIAINMAFAILLVQLPHVLQLAPTGGWRIELEAIYLMSGLAVLFSGSGKFAVRPD